MVLASLQHWVDDGRAAQRPGGARWKCGGGKLLQGLDQCAGKQGLQFIEECHPTINEAAGEELDGPLSGLAVPYRQLDSL